MAEATWYLGPLGNMRSLVVPEPDIEINQRRYGGIFQGLSGARTMDVTGHRAEYTFNFAYLDRAEYLWLEALHARLVWGPHYLVNPLKKNRLTLQSSRVVDAGRSGLVAPASAEIYADHRNIDLTDNDLPVSAVAISEWTGDGLVRFDEGKFIPVLPGETITAGAWMGTESSSAPHVGVTLRLDWFDHDLDELSAPTVSTPFDVTSTWTRHSMEEVTPPAGAAGCRFSIALTDPDILVFLAAPQVQAGILTDFEIGGAAPQVFIDQLPTTSPRFPLRNATLTLLEA